MSLTCNFTGSDYNCSALFEGVPVSITVLQACFAAAIVIISVPMNILMIVATIMYHRLLDQAVVLVVSFLVSDIAVAVFYSGQVFFTSIARAWILGNVGCQLMAFLSIIGILSRWVTVALLSVYRFSKVFFPLSRPSKLLIGILLLSWVIALIVPTVLYFGNAIGFDITHPGCSFAVNFSTLNQGYFVAMIILMLCVCFAGAILPSTMYTAMYFKARSLRRIQPVTTIIVQNHTETVESQQRSRRANVTYCLLMINFLVFAALIVLKVVMKAIFMQISISPALSVALHFLNNNLSQSYLIADLGILLMNKDERKVLCKLLGRVSKLLSCGKMK